jgi:hypothetical protein
MYKSVRPNPIEHYVSAVSEKKIDKEQSFADFHVMSGFVIGMI